MKKLFNWIKKKCFIVKETKEDIIRDCGGVLWKTLNSFDSDLSYSDKAEILKVLGNTLRIEAEELMRDLEKSKLTENEVR